MRLGVRLLCGRCVVAVSLLCGCCVVVVWLLCGCGVVAVWYVSVRCLFVVCLVCL